MAEHINNLLRLEIDASDASNQITNHSGQTGNTTGWTASIGNAATLAAVTGLTGHYGGKAIKCDTAFVGAGSTGVLWLLSSPVACSPGEWASLQFNMSATATIARVDVEIVFYNSGGTQLSANGKTYLPNTAVEGTYKYQSIPFQAPAGTATVRYRVIANAVAGAGNMTVYVSKVMGVKSAYKSLVVDVPFTDGPVWQNILGSAYTLNFRRGGEIDGVTERPEIGTLNVSLGDPLMDPTKNARMRPGRAIRVMTNTDYPLWTGKITTLDVNYKNKKPFITLAAVDAWADVLNIQSPQGYSGTLAQRINAILSGKGIPYYVAGELPITSAVIDVQENATALDQIQWAAMAKTGFAYCEENGEINVWTYAKWDAFSTYVQTYSDDPADTGAVFYTDIDTNFGSQALTNSLMINVHNLNEEEGEKLYGPYTNASSISNWGAKTATVDVNDGVPSALADYYLKTYANPEIFASKVKFNGRDYLGTLSLYGLYWKARVKNADSGLDATYRIINIEHDITPDSWEVTVGFKPLEATGSITVTNPPGGASSGPGDLVVPEPGPLGSRNRNTGFSIANATWTTVPLNGADVLDQITWDNVNNRFVVPKDGRYTVSAAVRFVTNATGPRGVELAVNGVNRGWSIGAASTIGVGPSITRTFKLSAGDNVSMLIYQASGAALATDGGAGATFMDIAFIGY